MSLQWNHVEIAGCLARTPDHRTLAGEKLVSSFAIATNRGWKNAKGERQEEATFIECQAWAENADFIAGHFEKGDPIFVAGHLRQESWEKDGEKRSRLILVVERARFVESKAKPAAAAGGAT